MIYYIYSRHLNTNEDLAHFLSADKSKPKYKSITRIAYNQTETGVITMRYKEFFAKYKLTERTYEDDYEKKRTVDIYRDIGTLVKRRIFDDFVQSNQDTEGNNFGILGSNGTIFEINDFLSKRGVKC